MYQLIHMKLFTLHRFIVLPYKWHIRVLRCHKGILIPRIKQNRHSYLRFLKQKETMFSYSSTKILRDAELLILGYWHVHMATLQAQRFTGRVSHVLHAISCFLFRSPFLTVCTHCTQCLAS